jgi:ABC-2 type transport system ATP-binding protein
MSPPALVVEELTVQYGRRVAVDQLTLSLGRGEIVGVLGPNGAGKSTALLAIAGSVVPTRGKIEVGGVDLARDPLKARAQLGFADQPPSLYDFFTVSEHIAFIGAARGHREADRQRDLLARLGLQEMNERLCRELSFGMRQRVGLAAALVGDVGVVLLDETLNGLDPRAALAARETLQRAADGGAAILMSTHLLGVAERLCHRIVIMDGGRLVTDVAGNELAELLKRGPGALEEIYLARVAE